MHLVFIHGPAASGKLTTARALSAEVGYPVFHNHLVVDLLTTVFPFGTEPFVRLREQMWLAVFVDAARAGTSVIFTFAPEGTVVAGFPARVKAAVEAEGGSVHFVRLDVSEAEQERRLTDESRKAFQKLADVEVLRGMRKHEVHVEQPPADLAIDTMISIPEASAKAIVRHFGLTAEAVKPRYPGG